MVVVVVVKRVGWESAKKKSDLIEQIYSKCTNEVLHSATDLKDMDGICLNNTWLGSRVGLVDSAGTAYNAFVYT